MNPVETCPRCGESSYQRVVSMLHACRSCGYIAEGLQESTKENTDPLVKKLVLAIFETPAHHRMIIEQAKESGISVLLAQPIDEKSWLKLPPFEWFRAGYSYASTQTQAIRALSLVHPEDLYHAFAAILRGSRRAGKEPPKE